MDMIKEIIEENRCRKERISSPFDPLSGLGSTGKEGKILFGRWAV